MSYSQTTVVGECFEVHARDYARLIRMAERLDFRQPWRAVDPSAPFGGVKASGYGREGGAVDIDEYLDTNYVSIGGPDH